MSPPRQPLDPCWQDTDCVEGALCVGRFCSVECTTDGDCGADGACVVISCDDEPFACGNRCLPRCSLDDFGEACEFPELDGRCVELPSVASGTATVCQ